MSIVRNCIDIIGITPEKNLPNQINGQHIEFSETENLIIENNVDVKNIYQIIVDACIRNTREINTPINKIIVVDGYKKFKVAYYDQEGNMGVLELNSPYNLFFDIEDHDTEIEKISIYIADAYFELLNSKMLYCYIVYIADIYYFNKNKTIDIGINTNEYINGDRDKASHNKSLVIENEILKETVFTEMLLSDESRENFKVTKEIDRELDDVLIDIEAEYI